LGKTPIASTSFGQVHRAAWPEGRQIAVEIHSAGISKTAAKVLAVAIQTPIPLLETFGWPRDQPTEFLGGPLMKVWTAVLAMLGAISVAGAQDHKELPKPQKEHELLHQFEGQWLTTSRDFTNPAKTEGGKGTEMSAVEYGGYWLVINFRGEHQGKPFEGYGTLGYDPRKGKYVMTWIDNMSPYSMWAEGDADASGKVFTFVSDGCDPETGKPGKMRSVFEIKDADHRMLTFYSTGKDGPDKKCAEIHYTRKK
jgi:hypothetical protein